MVETALLADVRGQIFEVRTTHTYDPLNQAPGTLQVNYANGAGAWTSLIVESYYPSGGLIWDSGRLNDSEATSYSAQLIFHIGKSIHIKRWRPQFLNIPGDGGGEIFLELPHSGDVTIDLTCVG